MAPSRYPPDYPADVAEAFLRREAVPLQEALDRGHGAPSALFPAPSRSVLVRLIETMFFASVRTEEGHLNPVGVIFGESLAPLQAEQRPAWDFVRFASPLCFDVGQVAKLASACAWPRSFLVVVPQGESLVIAGIAAPHSRKLFDVDRLVRVLVPKPGTVAVYRGENEVIRYEHGGLRVQTPLPARRRYRSELDSIQRAVLGDHAEFASLKVDDNLSRLIEGMTELQYGGLLAIMGPEERPDQPFIEEAKRLDPPLRLGSALLEMYEANMVDQSNDQRRSSLEGDRRIETPPTDEERRDADVALAATERVNRWMEQIIGLTTIDGAVVMSHALDVLAFGAQLPAQSEDVPRVFSVSSDFRLEDWTIESWGARHRAAAGFVERGPERLAIIVSQDGDAATVQRIDSKVVYWPLWTPFTRE
jgi:hypothetical protein